MKFRQFIQAQYYTTHFLKTKKKKTPAFKRTAANLRKIENEKQKSSFLSFLFYRYKLKYEFNTRTD